METVKTVRVKIIKPILQKRGHAVQSESAGEKKMEIADGLKRLSAVCQIRRKKSIGSAKTFQKDTFTTYIL